MPEYVKSCKYMPGKEVEYIYCVLSRIREHEGKEKVLRKAMKALIDLSGEKLSSPIFGKDIVLRTGSATPSHGLWAWLDSYGTKKNPKTGAGIVMRMKGSPRAYLIKDKFRLALTIVYPVIVYGL